MITGQEVTWLEEDVTYVGARGVTSHTHHITHYVLFIIHHIVDFLLHTYNLTYHITHYITYVPHWILNWAKHYILDYLLYTHYIAHNITLEQYSLQYYTHTDNTWWQRTSRLIQGFHNMVGSIVVVGVLTRCALFYPICNLKAAQISVG